MLQKFINKKFLTGISKNHLINITPLLNYSLNTLFILLNLLKKILYNNKFKEYECYKTQTNNNQIFIWFNFNLPILIEYYTRYRIGEVPTLT